MMSQFGNKLREKLEELALPESDPLIKRNRGPFPIIGCTLAQIEEIKAWQEVSRLPDIYTQFLLAMGQRSGDLWVGSDGHYRRLAKLKLFANKLLVEDGFDFSLPDDAFVFFMHQGHTFYYFCTDGTDDDPPVYMYSQGYEMEPDNPFEDGPIKEWDHLSQLLTLFIVHRENKEAQDAFLAKYT